MDINKAASVKKANDEKKKKRSNYKFKNNSWQENQ